MLVSKGIIDLHGGTLSVYSEGEGRGCIFTLTLPMLLSHTSTDAKKPIKSDNSVYSDIGGKPGESAPPQEIAIRQINLKEYKKKASSSVSPEGVSEHNRIMMQDTNNVSRGRGRHFPWSLFPWNFFQRRGSMENECRRGGGSIDHSIDDYLRPIPPISLMELARNELLSNTNASSAEKGEFKVSPVTDILSVTVKKRALIVDDVAMNRKMIRRAFDGLYECSEAVDGKQALELVREGCSSGDVCYYDIITMDFQMPVMDGITATREIRGLGYIGVIVGVTGNALQEDIDAFVRNGANTVLKKPITAKQLLSYLSSSAD